jgi:hypothetical protein
MTVPSHAEGNAKDPEVKAILAAARALRAGHTSGIVVYGLMLAFDVWWAATGHRLPVLAVFAIVQAGLLVLSIAGRRLTGPRSPGVRLLIEHPEQVVLIRRSRRAVEVVGAGNVRTLLRPPEGRLDDFARMLVERCPNAALKS